MSTVESPIATAGVAGALRRLYFVRFAFAIVWAILLFTTKADLGALGVTLVVIYPLFDLAAAVVDARSSHPHGSARGLYVNMAISAIATIGPMWVLSSRPISSPAPWRRQVTEVPGQREPLRAQRLPRSQAGYAAMLGSSPRAKRPPPPASAVAR